jgi:ubiquinone/menaquinone biosynthesis C-methylase UbiE
LRYGKRTNTLRELRRILKPGGKIVVSNMRYGWSPQYIFLNDIKRKFKSLGFFKTFALVFKHLPQTIQMYRCSRRVLSEAEKGELRFMDEEEIARKLEKAGFVDISPDDYIYAKQAIMNSARK